LRYEVEGLIVTDDRNYSPREGERVVLLERWCAFPPDHPTTRLCLRLMKKAFSTSRVESLLDVGTGTGVLAIAGLKLGAKSAIAVDISRIAAFSASRNMRLNSLERQLEIRLGSIDSVRGSFDLIVANLLLSPLLQLASGLRNLLSPAGVLILSGIYESELKSLETSLAKLGLERREMITDIQYLADCGSVTWAAAKFGACDSLHSAAGRRNI